MAKSTRTRKPRPGLAIAAIVVILSVGLVTIAGVALSEHPRDAQAIVGVGIAVVGVLAALCPMLWQYLTSLPAPVDSKRELEDAATDLASRAGDRWAQEAVNRGVTDPATIRVSWTRTTSPATRARPPRAVRPRGLPLASPAPRLLDAGVVEELYDLYMHPEVDKVVLIGKAGAGKTGALIQLLLEALRQRKLPENQAFGLPVPVLLTLGDWDPSHEGLIDWADRVLRRDYGAVFMTSGASVYRSLLKKEQIALFLDGLEEMPRRLWSRATQMIQKEQALRVVLTARPGAARDAHIPFAARVRLDPVEVNDAIDYLVGAADARVHPAKWEALTVAMSARPSSVVADVLTTPLMLTLALNTYDRPGQDPRRLADETLFPDRPTMEQFLIGQIIPVAFEHTDTDDLREVVDASTAERYLRELAARMGETRDLAWWRIRKWLPAFPPVVLCVAIVSVMGIVIAFLAGAAMGVAMALPAVLVAAPVAGRIPGLRTHVGYVRPADSRSRQPVDSDLGAWPIRGRCR